MNDSTTEPGWREVTKEEFFRVIGPQNVHPTPEGKYPYTSIYKTPSGRERGKSVGYIPEGKGLPEHRYLLPE